MSGARRGSARWPDVFLVGAPRSGTTTMYAALGAHPEIYMPERKEPHFFSSDLDSGSYLDSLYFTRDESEYLSLFAGARAGQRIGEASTSYLLSREAADRISRALPQARIIVMLRHPVDMIRSFHGRRLFSGAEDIPRLEDAIGAEDDRRAGRRIPASVRNIPALFYRDVARYGEQLQRFFDRFPREQIHVLIFEEFRTDPDSAYRSTLEFLGVDPSFRTSLDARNAARGVRSRLLHRVALAPVVVRSARAVVPAPVRRRVRPLLDRVNAVTRSDAAVPEELHRRLMEELRPDITHLGQLLGRDLTAVWR